MATAIKSKTPPKQGGKFRVLVGEHIGKGPEGCECQACIQSNGLNHRYRSVVYKGNYQFNPYELDEWVGKGKRKEDHPKPIGPDNPYDGDIVDSDEDLALLHNFPPGPNFPGSFKFERLDDQGRSSMNLSTFDGPPPSYPLEKMTLAQLMAVADDEGISLQGKTKKEDIIAAIELAREQFGQE